MHICYIDESGTSSIPGNTSHFVLAGLSVPIRHWKDCDKIISALKGYAGLAQAEIHTAWMMRKYSEQNKVPNFSSLNFPQRRYQVDQLRKAELFRLQKLSNSKHYQQTKKNYRETDAYIHLTHEERKRFLREIAERVSGWNFARLFAECIDKIHFDPARHTYNVDETAFDQIVSRFEQYLNEVEKRTGSPSYGLLVHDNNPTVAKKHTRLMQTFHRKGTLWTGIHRIIETPLFVESDLTSMVQIADLIAYALRRYLENGESELFDLLFQRADRRGGIAVGVRHFTNLKCGCKICAAHRVP